MRSAREQFILDFYGKVDPIDAHTPNSGPVTGTDSVFVDLVDADVTNIRWSVDGKVVADGTATSFDLSDNGFGLGNFAVTALAYDETDWLRVQEGLAQQAVDWAVQIPTGATGGNNTLTGTARIDKIFALGGADVVSGLAADDLLDGGSGNDVLRGGDGADRVVGADGADQLFGDLGGDILTGGGGKDMLRGGLGTDRLFGDLGGDTLIGGGGKDMLRGGLGTDRLTGGSSADRFDFDRAAECGIGAARDVITDFIRSQADKIDLATIDAKSTVSGNQAFTFVGTKALSGAAGQLRCSDGIIQGDSNGDGAADLELQVLGPNTMQSSDFLL
jgi:serralysin